MIEKKVDWSGKVLEQKSTKSEIIETTDEFGRKVKLVTTERIILPDGTTIERAKSCPIGVAILECGHKTPVWSYEAKNWQKLYCYRCKTKKKPVEFKFKER